MQQTSSRHHGEILVGSFFCFGPKLTEITKNSRWAFFFQVQGVERSKLTKLQAYPSYLYSTGMWKPNSEMLHSATLLYLAYGGSAAESKGLFGAVLATDKHILAECGGRAQGANPCSFRAEGYGILAVLRLVFYLRYLYVTRNTHLRFRLYCDSKSLLKWIETSRSLRRVTPCQFLYSEVDVEMQILSAIRALGW
jgi:hypothetical protein